MTREQFTSQVEATQGALRRFLIALCCGDAALADDIAQDAYVKAYLSLDRFRNDAGFGSWIYRIAYNCFVDSGRTRREHVDVAMAAGMHSDELSDSRFRYQALYAALARLSERERTAILLYYLEGYSIKEVAEIIGASQDAVKQQLSRGRFHLKGMLHERE